MSPSLQASTSDLSLSAVPAEKMAQGAGTFNFFRQMGGAFGVNMTAFEGPNGTLPPNAIQLQAVGNKGQSTS